MLLPAPPLYPRKRSARATRVPPRPSPVVTGPVLVAATYEPGDLLLSMTFDRAIDVSAINVAQIVVFDGTQGIEFGGTADMTMVGPQTLTMIMIENGEYAGEGVKLTVTGGAGIVSSGDGVAWAGVTDVALPFP